MRSFAGKVAVVTGAASGIGLAAAEAFADQGMDVALIDLRGDEVQAAADRVRRRGGRAIGLTVDVADADAVEAAAEEVVAAFGKIHVLMNNAGVFIRGNDIVDIGDDVWDWLLGVNLYGAIHGIRSFLPRIQAQGEGGHIVTTCSISGLFVGARKNGVYATSKFALVALSEALAHDLAGSDIGVSVVLPGAVATEFYVTSAQHRGDLGGPNLFATTPADTAAGMTPGEVAARMIDGVREGRFYIATAPETRSMVEARHRQIMDAYDAAEAWTPPAAKR